MNLEPQPQPHTPQPQQPLLHEADTPSTNPADDAVGDEITGLPGLPTWRGVYLFVCLVFTVYVVLLTIMSRVFT